MSIETDVVIIGAGPCGLFQAFELGLLDLRAHIIDALPQVGGQCSELYPSKPIYDIPGFPRVGALELVDNLMQQIKPFEPTFHLGQQVQLLQKTDDGRFHVATTADTEFLARAVIIAGGVGSFQPVRIRLDGIDRFENHQLFYRVKDPSQHYGKKVVVLGGGDSALDWALQMADHVTELTLIHRSANFRAAPASVAKFQALVDAGRAKLILGTVLSFTETDGRLSSLGVTALDKTQHTVAVDDVLAFYGLSPKLGPIAEWGLTLDKTQIEVDTEKFQSSTPGIYAVGDVNIYPGKKKLILSGFHEAALAAFAVKHQLFPDEKVRLQYTTTSTSMHKRLGVPSPVEH
ncbi:MAG TPA: NAD(P)/FAD-dependent oxidoreductase [Nevskiaceae bacterium]|nr:NAD(P)/FAD-dependent oxidoreductase [Nevskiaceae bacterium]